MESQQESASQARPSVRKIDPGEAARRAERSTLMLARTRAQQDLQGACAPAYRAMLEQAIADLDQRIAALK